MARGRQGFHHRRWAFAELRDAYAMDFDFEVKLENEFNQMIQTYTLHRASTYAPGTNKER